MKMAMVYDALRKLGGVKQTIIHTGQHYSVNMSYQIWLDLGLPAPDRNLQIGLGSSVTGHVAKILDRLPPCLDIYRPEIIVNYGDTNSALGTALTARALDIPLAHVEAGVRSFDNKQPEEFNRIVCDHAALVKFAPGMLAYKNLRRLSLPGMTFEVGDVMRDSVLAHKAKASRNKILKKLGLTRKKFILLTIHRPENTDNPLRFKRIIDALCMLRPRMPVVFPIHPRTNSLLEKGEGERLTKLGWRLINPVNYHQSLKLAGSSKLVVTDSGGLQREAYYLGVFSIVVREKNEWKELEWTNACFRVSSLASPKELLAALRYGFVTNPPQPVLYGSGEASDKIAKIIKDVLQR